MSRFGQAAEQAAPSMILVFLVVVLWAAACKDAFNDEVVDQEMGEAYFDTMRHSLITSFRILVGEWNDAMFAAVGETTEATQLWFYGMAFMLSVLLAELIIGVIMSLYAKVNEMENRRLRTVLAPIFEFRRAESEVLLAATLELCRKLRVYNKVFLQINKGCEQSTQSSEQINDSDLASAPAPGATEQVAFPEQAPVGVMHRMDAHQFINSRFVAQTDSRHGYAV